MYIQDRDSVYDLSWNDQIRYGDLFQKANMNIQLTALKRRTGGFFQLFDPTGPKRSALEIRPGPARI